MKKYKNILNILEKILFVILLVVVIVIASGYKYDPVKKELVLTGVLKIENLEDNTTLTFNNTEYKNKSNLSVSLLDNNQYDLKITKDARKLYDTKVQINPGEVTYINPVLIPDTLQPTLVHDNAENIVINDTSTFYTYLENKSIFLERLNINKNLFNVDLNKARIDITSLIDSTQPINIHTGTTNNFVVITNGNKIILADYNRLTAIDISSSLPSQTIDSIEVLNDFILIRYNDALYSININDPQKILRSLIFTSKNFLYTVDENNQIIIFYTNDKDQNLIETYNLSGALQNRVTLTSPVQDINEKTDLIYFYKNIYLSQGSTIYRLDVDKLVEFQKEVTSYSEIDRNNFLILNGHKAYIMSHERVLTYDFAKSADIKSIQIMPDLFTYIYTDKSDNLHLADFGGQDNIIETSIDKSFIASQSGSDTYIVYRTGKQIQSLRLGNTR